jgi:tyrosine-protein kinase Etk/Wzc
MEPSNSPINYNLPEDEEIDIKRKISMFFSNWYWFGVAFFIAMSLAYGINRYSQSIYSVSSSLLIKDDQLGGIGSNAASVIPGGDIFKSQQNLKNEIGILKSFNLNYRVMNELPEFHVIYVGAGKRGIVESRMYKTCPFKVVYDSLALEPKGTQVSIKILSEQKYILELHGNLDVKKEMNFGDHFSECGFDFTLEHRNRIDSVYSEDS